MRTSLRLDDESYQIASQFAKSNGMSLNKAVSELIRRGVGETVATVQINGVTVFDVPSDLPLVTTKYIRDIEVEEI